MAEEETLARTAVRPAAPQGALLSAALRVTVVNQQHNSGNNSLRWSIPWSWRKRLIIGGVEFLAFFAAWALMLLHSGDSGGRPFPTLTIIAIAGSLALFVSTLVWLGTWIARYC